MAPIRFKIVLPYIECKLTFDDFTFDDIVARLAHAGFSPAAGADAVHATVKTADRAPARLAAPPHMQSAFAGTGRASGDAEAVLASEMIDRLHAAGLRIFSEYGVRRDVLLRLAPYDVGALHGLVDDGADPNAELRVVRDADRSDVISTPLERAAAAGRADFVGALLARGARDHNNLALDVAKRLGHHDIVALLHE